MSKYVYPAVFHPNKDDGSITVTVPSLPGCITEGKDLADAIYMAGDPYPYAAARCWST